MMSVMLRLAIGLILVLVASAGRTGAQPDPTVTDTAVIRTTAGTLTLELYGEDAPRAVENFKALARRGFYRGLLFHRVVPGFVLQAGDPATRDTSLRGEWGRGGESSFGEPFADELNPNAPSYRRGYVDGTLAMANRGPNTNTSQFFIAMNDGIDMPKVYTIFGKLIGGRDVARTIERAEFHDLQSCTPVYPVAIIDITILPATGDRQASHR
jgi:cyclophilin family peptidyl-prolyl cis-trans isomerase